MIGNHSMILGFVAHGTASSHGFRYRPARIEEVALGFRRREPFGLVLSCSKFRVDVLGEKNGGPEWMSFEILGSLQTKIAEISHLKWHHRSINDAIHSNI